MRELKEELSLEFNASFQAHEDTINDLNLRVATLEEELEKVKEKETQPRRAPKIDLELSVSKLYFVYSSVAAFVKFIHLKID